MPGSSDERTASDVARSPGPASPHNEVEEGEVGALEDGEVRPEFVERDDHERKKREHRKRSRREASVERGESPRERESKRDDDKRKRKHKRKDTDAGDDEKRHRKESHRHASSHRRKEKHHRDRSSRSRSPGAVRSRSPSSSSSRHHHSHQHHNGGGGSGGTSHHGRHERDNHDHHGRHERDRDDRHGRHSHYDSHGGRRDEGDRFARAGAGYGRRPEFRSGRGGRRSDRRPRWAAEADDTNRPNKRSRHDDTHENDGRDYHSRKRRHEEERKRHEETEEERKRRKEEEEYRRRVEEQAKKLEQIVEAEETAEEAEERRRLERKRRREAIMAKYKQEKGGNETQSEEKKPLAIETSEPLSRAPSEVDLTRVPSTVGRLHRVIVREHDDDDGAGGDLTMGEVNQNGNGVTNGNGAQTNGEGGASGAGAGEGEDEGDDAEVLDMFADDIDEKLEHETTKIDRGGDSKDAAQNLTDNWDDAEGFYRIQIGETMQDRYRVTEAIGRGVFSTVLRATDTETGEVVAIKIIRNNESMKRSGQQELEIMQLLAKNDKHQRYHCVRLIDWFECRNHLCLVMEPLSMNLRQIIRKYGKDVGISLNAVRIYTRQLLFSLHLLRKCHILHADIKPDNIVCNDARNVIKLCDFGSASGVDDNPVTPYLQSRFYRAPEIMLGLRYGHPADMWSVACVVYELYTGKFLFQAPSNNGMLWKHMRVKGAIPKKMLKQGEFAPQHFDMSEQLPVFLKVDYDKILKKDVVTRINVTKPEVNMFDLLADSAPRLKEADRVVLNDMCDLLEKMLIFDPSKRITVQEALRHPFMPQ